MKARKILFVELDGATWDVINPLLEADKLPNIQSVISKGVSGPLSSIPPLVSPKIWTSIFSGKCAAKTGIEFFGANANMVTCKRIWDILEERGLTVGVCGTFVTWPPRDINGFMIPSVDSLGTETYPSEYSPYQEVALNETRKGKALGGRYASYLPYLYYAREFKKMGVSTRTLFDMCKLALGEKSGMFSPEKIQWEKAAAHLRSFTDLFLHLYGRFAPDFSTFHIHICDYISHRFWKFYEPGEFSDVDLEKVRRYGKVIPEAYMEADMAIGKIVDKVSPDGLIIASDHGFQALPERGYDFQHELILEILGMKEKAIVIPCGGGIYLKFLDDKLSDGAGNILKQAYLEETGDRIYHVKRMGNVLLVTKPTWKIDKKHIRDDAPVRFGDRGIYKLGELFSEGQMSGWHSEEGIIAVTGPGIKAGSKVEGASVYDLTPTILYMLGYPAAKDMDGKILASIFEKDVLDRYPPEYVDSYEETVRDVETGQEDIDYKKTEERLKSLGYL